LRTKEVHDYHLQALQTDAKNGPVYGVMHRCPLLDLPYIDLNETFVPDIMDDLLEGVIPDFMHKVIHGSIRNNNITLETVNNNLKLAALCN